MKHFFGNAIAAFFALFTLVSGAFNAILAMTIFRNLDTMNGNAIPLLVLLSLVSFAFFTAIMLED
jgi:hypothetical protein